MSTQNKLTAIANTKTAIKSAIEEKGVTVGNVPFSAYADKISSITTGASESGLGLVKVTQYQPYRAQFSGVTSVEITGLTYDENQDMDNVTNLNGVYTVTSATAEKANYTERVFVHSSNNYSMKFHVYNQDVDYMAPDTNNRWVLVYNNSEYPSYYLGITSAVENASNINLYSDMVWGKTFNTNVITSNYAEQPFILQGKNVQSYNTENKLWSFSSNVQNFSAVENTVENDYIYPIQSGVILGHKVALGADIQYTVGRLYYQDVNKVLDMTDWTSTVSSWNASNPNAPILTDTFKSENGAVSLIGKYGDNHAVKMYGYFNLNTAGNWKFYAKHDDGIALKVGEHTAVHSGVYDGQDEMLSFNVSATGWVQFAMYFHNATGDRYYTIYVQSPNDNQPVELSANMVKGYL